MTDDSGDRSGTSQAIPAPAIRLRVFNGGFISASPTGRRLRRILQLSGFRTSLGWPRKGDLVGIWGQSPTAWRGTAVANRAGTDILRVEDWLFRSLHPGRSGEPPIGLALDRSGLAIDATRPSDLETLLARAPLSDPALLARAEGLIDRIRESDLTKYAAVLPNATLPDPGYVLIIDQVRGDASVRLGGATTQTFQDMLEAARAEHPSTRIVIKTHPETRTGHRPGYYGAMTLPENVTLFDLPVSPQRLLNAASAVYTASSQMGFEAIIAGHRPHVFGLPFYAGWGLTNDRHPDPLPRRARTLSATQLIAGALILYPVWYDPCLDRVCSAEAALEQLAAEARAWREDYLGWTGIGIRLWKRRHFQKFFGRQSAMQFSEHIPDGGSRRVMRWASADALAAPKDRDTVNVEDGFLRSRGLGANLIPPLSMAVDDLGIYYDPSRESRMERLITERASLRPDQILRVRALIARLHLAGITKYNSGTTPKLPAFSETRCILVPGQVEDDASIRLGAGDVRTNLDLLRHVRGAAPDAIILYKPHPDVEAGLRPGRIDDTALAGLADHVLRDADPAQCLELCDEVWTMTSLMGFEALLRGKTAHVLGQPFYAGWGLTRDHSPRVARRTARPSLEGLAHAALIDYPRYMDPVTGLPCPVETALTRLEEGTTPREPHLRLLSKLQGLLASRANLWR